MRVSGPSHVFKNFWLEACDGLFLHSVLKKVDLVAQLVEHNTFNVGALGSSPSGITLNSLIMKEL